MKSPEARGLAPHLSEMNKPPMPASVPKRLNHAGQVSTATDGELRNAFRQSTQRSTANLFPPELITSAAQSERAELLT